MQIKWESQTNEVDIDESKEIGLLVCHYAKVINTQPFAGVWRIEESGHGEYVCIRKSSNH
jgi:hypothetical protein